MGGKNKQAQRTKNNVRPSSSSRSAEMLGSMVPSFVGFSTGKDGGLVPVLPGLSIKDDFDSTLDPDFQIVFKKMTKKDSTTKIKALTEFTTLVNAAEESTLCATLAFWPCHYCQLSTDTEHRVREAAQTANGAIVRKCGRSVAPYLKQLAPVWITAQYDTYAPAAMQAESALQAVIPASKLPDLMSFCRAEILAFITDNLIEQTPTTLSNPKTSTPEECESKYERVIIASLQGFALFINNLPQAHMEWLCTEQSKILDSNKFWSLGNHKTPQIRSGFFMVIGALCQCQTEWFSPKHGKKSIELIIAQINERDSTVSTSIWENAILLMTNTPEWWNYVDLEKNVMPGVYMTLSAGGWSSTGRLAPLLLPLLAQLSKTPIGNNHFYDMFFDAILKGLEQRCVLSSKSECSAWLKGLSECIQYVSVGAVESENFLHTLSRTLRLWLSAAARSHLTINPLMPLKLTIAQMSELAYFWTKQSLLTEQANVQFYSQLVRVFWQNVQYIFTTQIDNLPPDESKIKEITEIQREIIMGFKNSMLTKSKRITRVKFDGDDSQNDAVPGRAKQSNVNTPQSEEAIKQAYEHNLNCIAYEVCAKYFMYAGRNSVSTPILSPLYSLILDFETVELYTAMQKIVMKDQADNKTLSWFTEYYYNWLRGDSMRSQSVVDLTMSVFKFLSDADQRVVLKQFDQLPLSKINWCITRCLSHPHNSCPSVRDWLQGDAVHQSLLSMARLVVKEGDRHHATVVKMCFAQDNNGDILISNKSCSAVIGILSESLSQLESVHLDMCASFTSQLAASVDTDGNNRALKDLALNQFTLNCNLKGGSEMLSHDTWWEVNTCWQDTLPALAWEDRLWFIEKSTEIIYKIIVPGEAGVFDESETEACVDLTFQAISSCINDGSTIEDKMQNFAHAIQIILKLQCDNAKSWTDLVIPISMSADFLLGKLDWHYIKTTKWRESIEGNEKLSSDDIIANELNKMLPWYLYCIKLIDKLMSEDSDSGKENTDMADSHKTWLSDIISCTEMQNAILYLLYNVTVIKTLYNHYQAWTWYKIISDLYAMLESAAAHFVNLLSVKDYQTLLCCMEKRSEAEGPYWTACLHLCNTTLRASDKKSYYIPNLYAVLDEQTSKLQSNEDLPKCLSHQVFHSIQIKNMKDAKVSALLAVRSMCLVYSNDKKGKIIIDKDTLTNCLVSPEESLTFIIDKYYQHKSLMLYNLNWSLSDWNLVNCNSSIVRFLITSIENNGWELKSQHWDFITISLSSLVQSLDKSKESWNTTKVSLLGCAVLDLLYVVDNFISNVNSKSISEKPSDTVANLPQEWRDIFAPDIYQHLLELFLTVCRDCSSSKQLSYKDVIFLSALHAGMQKFEWKYIEASNLSQKYSIDSLVDVCYEALSTPCHHIVKFMAYKMLKKFTARFIQEDMLSLSKTTAEEEAAAEGEVNFKKEVPYSPVLLSVDRMKPALTHLQDCVESIVGPYVVGEDVCTVLPHTDAYSMTLGYLLLWDILLEITQDAVGYLQHQYTEIFREEKNVEHLVSAIFRLLPKYFTKGPKSINDKVTARTPPTLDTRVAITSDLLSEVSWQALRCVMRGGVSCPPVRGWWAAQAPRASQHVEQVVSTYFTKELVILQMSESSRRKSEIPGLQVSVYLSENKMIGSFVIDDTKIEMSIELASNHPLNIPKVVCHGSLTNQAPWLTKFLAYQNGTLWKVLTLWVNSIQRKVDSSPICHVCYTKLHPTSGQLPKVLCRTCKNRFHSICLYKWYSMGNSPVCVLCRNPL